MSETEPKIEMSPRSGPVTRDDTTVEVEIYRLPHRAGWTLEVIDHEAGTTVWETTFDTDDQAYRIFTLALDTEGIRSFAEAPKSNPLQLRLHR
jgi:hypothetical protein